MRNLYNFVFGRRSRALSGSHRVAHERPGEPCNYCGFGNVTSLPWVGLSVE